ncbi:serine hydrolase domain-containing protein [Cyclobacterium marinum]|uniref:serine hydrolase domain-containing protein n=1 Tax=Cyclobacterium marinum TaxID=104 RepID=UPI0011EC5CD5|nr:serine hydrolase domain-containing protein [Cyclobacterium marinum]MBI0398600.1 beta-lactamase family protein [Cyclobacterium marinum]
MFSTDRKSTIFTAWHKAFDQFSNKKKLKGLVLSIFKEDTEPILWSDSTKDISLDQPYFITELGNIHLLAIIIKLKIRGLLTLDQSISEILSENEYSGLINIKGKDFTDEVTVSHLLLQRSGIPDFLNHSSKDEPSIKSRIYSGEDLSWSIKDILNNCKDQKANFKPGKSTKSVYSATNDLLLGKIIEKITGDSLEKAFHDFHFSRLSMNQTYVYTDIHDRTPALFSYKNHPLILPLAMSSFGGSGGIVSTTRDSLTFLKAFFHGHLFPMSELENLMNWIPVKQGLRQGIGISHYQKPRIFPLASKEPEFIGYTGHTSGAFSLYAPEFQIFMTGTTNQSDDPFLPYKLASAMIKELN